MVAATAVADLAAQALKEVTTTAAAVAAVSGVSLDPLQSETPPEPLPAGWIMKEARSQPRAFYYYNQVTGESSWDPPAELVAAEAEERKQQQQQQAETTAEQQQQPKKKKTIKAESGSKTESSDGSSRKRSHDDHHHHHHHHKAAKTEDSDGKKRRLSSTSSSVSSSTASSSTPSQVRVLHILKKHKDSRRPSSWRSNNQPITMTREEAIEELQGLLEILQEEEANPDNLVATFKELASQESDCSSAKRNGDLGFFGRKKMRPEFEEAAFGLNVNQLSKIVETASGAHILLRLE